MSFARVAAALALVAAAPFGAAAGEGVRVAEGVPYVSGGVTEAERRELEAAAGRFNLRVTVANEDGPYLGPSSIRIEGEDGETVLAIPTRGPIFLARLAPGSYRVRVEEAGQAAARWVQVKEEERAEVRFVLRWEDEEHGA